MTDYDVLVVGAGIGGMESALKLGDMGYKVLLVEKEASVGGKMILLSKVFPTLDCASCISTPEDGGLDPPPQRHDPDLQRGRRDRADGDGRFQREDHGRRRASSTRRPAPAARSARRRAPWPCPTSSTRTWSPATRPTSPSPRPCPRRRSSSAPARRRARSPARPASRPTATCRSSAAASTRRPSSSCSTRRRSSARSGRACYAPCEVDCTRGSLEGPLPIRRLKRFIADEHYDTLRRSRASRSRRRTAIASPSSAPARPA